MPCHRERFNEPVRSAPDLLKDNKRLPPPPPSLTDRDSRPEGPPCLKEAK